MKQPGIFFILFGFLTILYDNLTSTHTNRKKNMNTIIYVIGAALPFFVAIVVLYGTGVLNKFWFWTVEYALIYGSQVSLSSALINFKRSFISVTDEFYFLWIFSAAGFIALFFNKTLKNSRCYVILFVICSFLSLCSGFYFRGHYYIFLLPGVAILSGIFFYDFSLRTRKAFKSYTMLIVAAIFMYVVVTGVVRQKDYFMGGDTTKLSDRIYGRGGFVESVAIAEFIKKKTNVDDKILVFGSEPQICFLAGRRSSTGYIYMYDLMQTHKYTSFMQKEMIREIESARPKFIVKVNMMASWLIRQKSEKHLFVWFDEYVLKNYTLVGVVDILPRDETVYRWYEEARKYQIQSPSSLIMYDEARKFRIQPASNLIIYEKNILKILPLDDNQ